MGQSLSDNVAVWEGGDLKLTALTAVWGQRETGTNRLHCRDVQTLRTKGTYCSVWTERNWNSQNLLY
jgi:hypothetical protein